MKSVVYIKGFIAWLFLPLLYKKAKCFFNQDAISLQERVFSRMLKEGRKTIFGKDYGFQNIRTYEDYKSKVPIFSYEDIKPYIDRVISGESKVLSVRKIVMFFKTSGTIAGSKYIPVVKSSKKAFTLPFLYALVKYHFEHEQKKIDFGKAKFLGVRCPEEREPVNGIPVLNVAGFIERLMPSFMNSFFLSYVKDDNHKLGFFKNFSTQIFPKKDSVVATLGLASWQEELFTTMLGNTIKEQKIGDLFKKLSLIVFGGLSIKPYLSRLNYLIGRKIDFLELYGSSEGNFAVQNDFYYPEGEAPLHLITDYIFYEFIPLKDYQNDKFERISLEGVVKGVDYVLIITTPEGLYAYDMVDVIRFVSINPYKIVFIGRAKHFISSFGEHLITFEVEEAISKAQKESRAQVIDFTVAPKVRAEGGQSCHQWYVEFSSFPNCMDDFIKHLDNHIQEVNMSYSDLRKSGVIGLPELFIVKKGGFKEYMQAIGRYGDQGKMIHLLEDRKIVEEITDRGLLVDL